jgi:hypothetical protein
MKKIYYEKVGRRYIPVSEYDSDYLDSFPTGSHLVMCYPGGQSRKYNIDPNYAALIAAGRVAEDAISDEIRRASDLRPRTKPLTLEQEAAWKHLVEVFGPEAKMLEWPSAREAAEKAVEAMQEEADKLLKHPAVKRAWDHFMTVAKIAYSENNDGKVLP